MEKNEIKKYLLNNEETLLDVVNELNCWNGCLDYLDFWENDDEFFDTYFDSPMEIIRAIHYGDYNYTDDYVKFSGYGILVSYTEDERYENFKENIDNIVECLMEYLDDIEIYDENLEKLLEDEI